MLTLRVAVRGGQQLARCAFDISELVPKSGCSIVGPEHFAMGDWTLTASIEAEVPGVPERAELDLGADEDEAALYGTPPSPPSLVVPLAHERRRCDSGLGRRRETAAGAGAGVGGLPGLGG